MFNAWSVHLDRGRCAGPPATFVDSISGFAYRTLFLWPADLPQQQPQPRRLWCCAGRAGGGAATACCCCRYRRCDEETQGKVLRCNAMSSLPCLTARSASASKLVGWEPKKADTRWEQTSHPPKPLGEKTFENDNILWQCFPILKPCTHFLKIHSRSSAKFNGNDF